MDDIVITNDAEWEKQKKNIFLVYNKEDKAEKEVSSNDFGDILTSLGIKVTEEQLKQYEKEIELEKNGVLNYDQFSQYVDRAYKISQRDIMIINAFKTFSDQDGYIDLQLFQRIMTTMGNKNKKLSKDEMKTILNDAGFDPKTQKTIHYTKIMQLIQKNVF